MTRLTDEVLRDQLNGANRGAARAAEYLLEVPEHVREDICSEARIMTNVSPGWRYADAVYHHVREYETTGAVGTRYRDINRELIAVDPHGFKAAGIKPEQLGDYWPSA